MKRLIPLFIALSLMLNISVFAMEVHLPLEKIEYNYKTYRDDSGKFHTVCVYDTGLEYLKIDYMNIGVDLYRSHDRENWEYIKFISEDIMHEYEHYIYMFPGDASGDMPSQIINTGNEYLVRTTLMDNITHPYILQSSYIIAVYDLDFNYVRSIGFGDSYIVKMSYIDGVCYVTLSNSKTYRSADLVTWEELYDGIGIPISNGEKTIFTTHVRKAETHYTGDLLFNQIPILSKDGRPDRSVVVDQLDMQTTGVYGKFFVNYDNRDAERYYSAKHDSYVEKKNKKFPARVSFSKDGVYWATLTLPEESINKITRIEEDKDSIVILASGTYRLKYSDMESVVPRSDTYVEVNNEILGFDTPPVLEADRTLVPMRFLFEKLGAEVAWDEVTNIATATLPANGTEQIQTFGMAQSKSVSFSINNTTATVNGAAKEMDVPARLINDRTMVPLRFLSENLGYTVTWDETAKTAIIE